ncbi:hypothetical protein [Streptomyces sp. NPDC057675]
MVVIALFLPALLVLMLFGLEALENVLFPQQAEPQASTRTQSEHMGA